MLKVFARIGIVGAPAPVNHVRNVRGLQSLLETRAVRLRQRLPPGFEFARLVGERVEQRGELRGALPRPLFAGEVGIRAHFAKRRAGLCQRVRLLLPVRQQRPACRGETLLRQFCGIIAPRLRLRQQFPQRRLQQGKIPLRRTAAQRGEIHLHLPPLRIIIAQRGDGGNRQPLQRGADVRGDHGGGLGFRGEDFQRPLAQRHFAEFDFGKRRRQHREPRPDGRRRLVIALEVERMHRQPREVAQVLLLHLRERGVELLRHRRAPALIGRALGALFGEQPRTARAQHRAHLLGRAMAGHDGEDLGIEQIPAGANDAVRRLRVAAAQRHAQRRLHASAAHVIAVGRRAAAGLYNRQHARCEFHRRLFLAQIHRLHDERFLPHRHRQLDLHRLLQQRHRFRQHHVLHLPRILAQQRARQCEPHAEALLLILHHREVRLQRRRQLPLRRDPAEPPRRHLLRRALHQRRGLAYPAHEVRARMPLTRTRRPLQHLRAILRNRRRGAHRTHIERTAEQRQQQRRLSCGNMRRQRVGDHSHARHRIALHPSEIAAGVREFPQQIPVQRHRRAGRGHSVKHEAHGHAERLGLAAGFVEQALQRFIQRVVLRRAAQLLRGLAHFLHHFPRPRRLRLDEQLQQFAETVLELPGAAGAQVAEVFRIEEFRHLAVEARQLLLVAGRVEPVVKGAAFFGQAGRRGAGVLPLPEHGEQFLPPPRRQRGDVLLPARHVVAHRGDALLRHRPRHERLTERQLLRAAHEAELHQHRLLCFGQRIRHQREQPVRRAKVRRAAEERRVRQPLRRFLRLPRGEQSLQVRHHVRPVPVPRLLVTFIHDDLLWNERRVFLLLHAQREEHQSRSLAQLRRRPLHPRERLPAPARDVAVFIHRRHQFGALLARARRPLPRAAHPLLHRVAALEVQQQERRRRHRARGLPHLLARLHLRLQPRHQFIRQLCARLPDAGDLKHDGPRRAAAPRHGFSRLRGKLLRRAAVQHPVALQTFQSLAFGKTAHFRQQLRLQVRETIRAQRGRHQIIEYGVARLMIRRRPRAGLGRVHVEQRRGDPRIEQLRRHRLLLVVKLPLLHRLPRHARRARRGQQFLHHPVEQLRAGLDLLHHLRAGGLRRSTRTVSIPRQHRHVPLRCVERRRIPILVRAHRLRQRRQGLGNP